MFVIEKIHTVEKGYTQDFLSRFSKPSVVETHPGFIKKEVWLSESIKEDTIKVLLYFVNKESYQAWHISDAHKELHKNKSKEKMAGLISVSRGKYVLRSESFFNEEV